MENQVIYNQPPQPITFTPVDANDSSNSTATATLSILIDDDNLHEIDGTIKVLLKNEVPVNTNYKVHVVNNNATLTVTNDD